MNMYQLGTLHGSSLEMNIEVVTLNDDSVVARTFAF